MEKRDANSSEQIRSEYELLFCLRDLMSIYMEQQIKIYGKCGDSFKATLDDIETRIEELDRVL